MERDILFWREMQTLILTNPIVIDRPKDKPHPRFPELIYPFDYGYLENTVSGDGEGIDVWFGSRESKTLTGILLTFDKIGRDAEIKLMVGCAPDDVQIIRQFLHEMLTLYIQNPEVNP